MTNKAILTCTAVGVELPTYQPTRTSLGTYTTVVELGGGAGKHERGLCCLLYPICLEARPAHSESQQGRVIDRRLLYSIFLDARPTHS